MVGPNATYGTPWNEILGGALRDEMRERGLKYDWGGPLSKLLYTPHPTEHPMRCVQVGEYAAEFISRWADWAELAKMQPVHLFRNDPSDPAGRGLAWRWTDVMEAVCFPRERLLVVESNGLVAPGTLFVYRFEPTGRTVHVFGAERQAILSAFIQLQAEPTIRQRYIASGGVG